MIKEGGQEFPLNAILMSDLQDELLRLRPGETVSKSNEWLRPIATNDFDRTCAVAEVGLLSGCDVQFNHVISENPQIIGAIFTRRPNVPLMDFIEPIGTA
jgi:hypothetical protein